MEEIRGTCSLPHAGAGTGSHCLGPRRRRRRRDKGRRGQPPLLLPVPAKMGFERSLMTYLGIQPWKVISSTNASPPNLRALSLAKLIAIQFFNVIWCVSLFIWIGYICFVASVRKALEDTSTNNMEYMVVIIALTINWLIAPRLVISCILPYDGKKVSNL